MYDYDPSLRRDLSPPSSYSSLLIFALDSRICSQGFSLFLCIIALRTLFRLSSSDVWIYSNGTLYPVCLCVPPSPYRTFSHEVIIRVVPWRCKVWVLEGKFGWALYFLGGSVGVLFLYTLGCCGEGMGKPLVALFGPLYHYLWWRF